MSQAPRPLEPLQASSWLATISAVAWSFFGVRRQSDEQRSGAALKPLPLIAVGIGGCIVFVLILVAIVKWVVPA